jgi:hypothetical protein
MARGPESVGPDYPSREAVEKSRHIRTLRIAHVASSLSGTRYPIGMPPIEPPR